MVIFHSYVSLPEGSHIVGYMVKMFQPEGCEQNLSLHALKNLLGHTGMP